MCRRATEIPAVNMLCRIDNGWKLEPHSRFGGSVFPEGSNGDLPSYFQYLEPLDSFMREASTQTLLAEALHRDRRSVRSIKQLFKLVAQKEEFQELRHSLRLADDHHLYVWLRWVDEHNRLFR